MKNRKCSYSILQRGICKTKKLEDFPTMTKYVSGRKEKWIKNFWVSIYCSKYNPPKLILMLYI